MLMHAIVIAAADLLQDLYVYLIYIYLYCIRISKESASLQFVFASLIILNDVSMCLEESLSGEDRRTCLTPEVCGEPFSAMDAS